MKLFRCILCVFGILMPLSSVLAEPVDIPVDINVVDAKVIAATMVGVGPEKARAIVEYRSRYGPFKTVDALAKVRGIGLGTIEKNRDQIFVGQPAK